MVNAEVVNIVKEYLHELSDKGVLISRCFLYGSQARGTANEDSDIDIILISPLFDENVEMYWPALWLSDIRTDNRIEPLAVGEKRFQTDDMSPILEVVRQEGLEIAA
ncbi:MAG: nucleotidyltransferase domain-containing protein [Syntrophomonadaceae bacterium]